MAIDTRSSIMNRNTMIFCAMSVPLCSSIAFAITVGVVSGDALMSYQFYQTWGLTAYMAVWIGSALYALRSYAWSVVCVAMTILCVCMALYMSGGPTGDVYTFGASFWLWWTTSTAFLWMSMLAPHVISRTISRTPAVIGTFCVLIVQGLQVYLLWTDVTFLQFVFLMRMILLAMGVGVIASLCAICLPYFFQDAQKKGLVPTT